MYKAMAMRCTVWLLVAAISLCNASFLPSELFGSAAGPTTPRSSGQHVPEPPRHPKLLAPAPDTNPPPELAKPATSDFVAASDFDNDPDVAQTGVGGLLDPIPNHHDSSFPGFLGSVFPLNSIITYDSPENGTQAILARYATFSRILDDPMSAHYEVFPGRGCEPIDAAQRSKFADKIVLVQRGECSFTQKVVNLLELHPRAIVVGNTQPHAPLITMFSDTLSESSVHIPVVFTSYEDYWTLAADSENPGGNTILTMQTVAMEGIFPLVLSAVLSPPIFVLLCFLFIRSMQYMHRRRICTLNQQYVSQLPVYIYNGNHLVPAQNLYPYLTATGQTNDLPSVHSSSDNLTQASDTELAPVSTSFVVGGTDLFALTDLRLLYAHKDFFPTQKCSICLSHFHPLRSRVLVLGCKHFFHEKCLSNWLINFRKSCPLCNERLQTPLGPDSYGSIGPDPEWAHVSESPVRGLDGDVNTVGANRTSANWSQSAPLLPANSRTESHDGNSPPLSPVGSPSSVASFFTTRSSPDTHSTASSHYVTPQTSSNTASQDTTDASATTETIESESSHSTIRFGA